MQRFKMTNGFEHRGFLDYNVVQSINKKFTIVFSIQLKFGYKKRKFTCKIIKVRLHKYLLLIHD